MVWNELIKHVERLDFSAPSSLAGAYFQETLAVLAIVFGGAFLLFANKHYEYFAGITGLLLGGWLGLLVRKHFLSHSHLSPVMYMGLFSVVGACIAVFYRRFIGILLGGFTAVCAVFVLAPHLLTVHPNQNLTFAAVFAMGGGLGALFPAFFFVLNTSLIGAGFVSYGAAVWILPRLAAVLPETASGVVHILVFLPSLLFGILYQMFAQEGEARTVFEPHIVINNPGR